MRYNENIEASEIQWWIDRGFHASPHPRPPLTHTTTLLESNTTTLLECNTWSCQGSSADKRAVGSLGGAWLRESKIGRKSETAGGPSLREVPILLARHPLYFSFFVYCQQNTIFSHSFLHSTFYSNIVGQTPFIFFLPPILSA